MGERLSDGGELGDAIRIYRNLNNVDDAATLDLLRLRAAAKALNSESDYDRYAYAALTKGYPGEAKAVLEEGIAAKAVDPNKSPFKEMIQQANAKSAGEAASLDGAAQGPRRFDREGGWPPATCSTATASMPRPPSSIAPL